MLSLAYAFSGAGAPQWMQHVAAHESTLLYVVGGFAAGAGVTVFGFIQAERSAPTSWVYIVLFCAAVMAVAAIRGDQLSFGRAILIVILGSMALVAAAAALERFRKGEDVELESNWGGLGGGLGGWRVSSVTCLSLLAVIFAASAVVATAKATAPPANQTSPQPAAAPSH
jgi:hypothetical protein